MKTYYYYFLDRDGSIPSFEIALLANDNEARERAPEMLRRRPARNAVEVWGNDLCIGSLSREDLARAS